MTQKPSLKLQKMPWENVYLNMHHLEYFVRHVVENPTQNVLNDKVNLLGLQLKIWHQEKNLYVITQAT